MYKQQEEMISCCEIEDFVLVFWNPGRRSLKAEEFSEEEIFLTILTNDVAKLIERNEQQLIGEVDKFMLWLSKEVLKVVTEDQKKNEQVADEQKVEKRNQGCRSNDKITQTTLVKPPRNFPVLITKLNDEIAYKDWKISDIQWEMDVQKVELGKMLVHQEMLFLLEKKRTEEMLRTRNEEILKLKEDIKSVNEIVYEKNKLIFEQTTKSSKNKLTSFFSFFQGISARRLKSTVTGFFSRRQFRRRRQ